MYSNYDFTEFLLNIAIFIKEHILKIILFGIIFIAGIIKIIEWIIKLF